MPYIQLTNISKRFEDVVALDKINLEIEEGEFISFLGPSGSGKTTLLRVIAGLTEPTEGEIFIGGVPITNIEVRKRNLSMVFQNYALFPHMDVAENIAFSLKVRRVTTEVTERKVKEALKMVRLPHIENRYPHQLSGGQQQRVALARALVMGPRLLLLDEPLGALDKKLRENMQIELKSLQQELGITTIFVTHDQEEALTMSDRIAVMNEGKVVQFDVPSNVYEKPASKFISDFIGVSNYFECRIVGAKEHCVIGRSASGLSIFIHWNLLNPQPENNETIMVTVRPEKIRIQHEKPQRLENVFAATIKNIVYLGSVTHYFLETEGGEQVVVYSQNLDNFAGKTRFSQGEKVFVHWPPEACNMVSA